MPNDLAALFADAVRLHQGGRLRDAEAGYRAVLTAQPQHPDALHLIGVIAYQQGRPEPALASIRQAIALQPRVADYHSNLGLALDRLGRDEEALSAFREALRLRPDYPEAHNNLANVLHRAGRNDEAASAVRQALRLRSDYAEAYTNLGNILLAQGQTTEAVAAHLEGVRLAPRSVEARFNLAIALRCAGQLEDALAAYRATLELAPHFLPARNDFAVTLHAAGKTDAALAELDRVVAAQANYAEAHLNRGLMLYELGETRRAEGALRTALTLRPHDVPTLNQCSIVARALGQMDEGLAFAERAVALAPDSGEAHNTLGNAFKDVGDLERAVAHYRRAVACPGAAQTSCSNLLLALHYLPQVSAAELGREHRQWARQHATPFHGAARLHANDRDPERRLRVGYVSPDLRQHAVARFLLPLFQHHDRTQFEVHAFSTVLRPDETTAMLRSQVDTWHDLARVDDAGLAAEIGRAKIDVLVDLAAHAAGSRLRAFARRPAPVQLTYLAYCSTTGLEAMDYRLSDPYLDPPGTDLSVYSERTFRLPRTYWCYVESPHAPAVNELPAARKDELTFGCLNNYAKVGPAMLQLWAKILAAVPRARLLLHAPRGRHRDLIMRRFADAGVAETRVQFVERVPLPDFFRLHQEIDVALDPFPFNGGTTTCDALWMGVPVVSLSGNTAVSRAGRSLLSNVGLSHLAANTPTDYARIATMLAADLPALATLRRQLRQRMRASPLMDAPAFARDLADAYRTMWQRWCDRG